MTRHYTTPAAFKEALEHRLRNVSSTGEAFARRRQRVVFDRLLARLERVFEHNVTLKGGLALELRIAQARATKDLDLRLVGSADPVLGRLREAGRLDLGDYMSFEIGPDIAQPKIQSEGMQYEGLRFRSECRLAGKIYGRPFGVDVAFADPMFGEPDEVVADDVLDFAGIEPPRLRLYPVETHLAEKLHAYTLPRTRPNTRIKDLPDLALLARTQSLDARRLRAAFQLTFAYRSTHPLPAGIPDPPSDWTDPYARLARIDGLPWKSLPELAAAVRAFLDPVLSDAAVSSWDSESWTWRS